MSVIDKDLILLDLNAENEEEIINALGNLLYSRQCVKDTYVANVVARERKYPTGLQTSTVNVAIPHTDSSHVIKTSMAVGVLRHPVLFNAMGSQGGQVEVEVVFMLAMKDPNQQVDMLRSLMCLLQDDKILHDIKLAGTQNEVMKILENYIN